MKCKNHLEPCPLQHLTAAGALQVFFYFLIGMCKVVARVGYALLHITRPDISNFTDASFHQMFMCVALPTC